MEQALSVTLEDRTAEELAGAYRALCAMMLLHTAQSFRKARLSCNEDVYRRKAARQWVRGACGAISFPECCEVLGLNVRKAKQAITEFAQRVPGGTISTETVETDNA